MGFGVIIIGDEILSGRRTDKHLPKIIELLSARGLSLDWAEYVGDEPDIAEFGEILRGDAVRFLRAEHVGDHHHAGTRGLDLVVIGEDAFERLQALKRRYDPRNVLRRNQNIPPGGP